MLVDNPADRLSQDPKTAHFSVSMVNDYLDDEGTVVKKQSLAARMTRERLDPFEDNSLVYDHVWNDVTFGTVRKEGQPETLAWSFARNQRFPSVVKTTVVLHDQSTLRPPREGLSGDLRWFQHLPATPAVNLLTLFSLDVLMFEEIYGALIGCTKEHLDGEPFLHEASAGRKMHLSLTGLVTAQSYFDNEHMMLRYLGVSRLRDAETFVFEFRGSGRLCSAAADNGRTMKGSSFYLGKISVGTAALSLQGADMIECLTLVSINRQGGRQSVPRRRTVKLVRIET